MEESNKSNCISAEHRDWHYFNVTPDIALKDYIAMGEGRSLQKLAKKYRLERKKGKSPAYDRLKDWSARYNWGAHIGLSADNALVDKGSSAAGGGSLQKNHMLQEINEILATPAELVRQNKIIAYACNEIVKTFLANYKASTLEDCEKLVRIARECTRTSTNLETLTFNWDSLSQEMQEQDAQEKYEDGTAQAIAASYNEAISLDINRGLEKTISVTKQIRTIQSGLPDRRTVAREDKTAILDLEYDSE